MTRYVAFLRGVNVGGHHPVRMGELRERLEHAGFDRVATVKASGNVVVDGRSRDARAVVHEFETVLRELTGGDVTVFLRSRIELERIVTAAPFERGLPTGDVPYVTFLLSAPGRTPTTPFSSPRGETTVLQVRGREVYALGRRVGNRPGFPNAFIEKWAEGPATTRAWTTVTEIASAFPLDPG